MGIRQDYKSVNVPRELKWILELCVTNIVSNGAPVYDKTTFVKEALEAKIEKERRKNKLLDSLITKYYEKQGVKT